ncbi:MAG: formate C-acetyltransferase/glycerol dehydratase family glycyl radical enzyme, partial [Bacteroidales bacterium]|nr:formate C-acetyltransferase/glycerol dehydratase family glycyl radical enzyme [Bacteroidales bacterium]
ELIVGERGPAPKAVPTYPEVCLHSLEDLEILHQREKVSFKSDEETRRVYQDRIIPYWQGNTQRDRLFAAMDPEWIEAYEAGVFTEFQEQRAPGHTVLGDKIYRKGLLEFIAEIDNQIEASSRFKVQSSKCEELTAMKIAAEAIIAFAKRHAEALVQRAEFKGQSLSDKVQSEELLRLAEICRRVPAYAPRTFHEALQYYWFVHLGVITELNPWDSFNPGRLDQNLYPFYAREIAAGTLTKERAKELLQSFWIKFNNHPAPPKIGVTAKESSTYTDFALINLGGLTADGKDAVNELTYLILDVIEEMRLLQPGSMVQLSHLNPDSFIERAIQIIRTGFGQPSVFNTDAIIRELVRQGKSLADARNGGASGCVESGAFGKEAYWLTGYFNLPKVLEITLYGGLETLGLETLRDFNGLLNAFQSQLNHFIDIKIKGNRVIEKLYAEHLPAPFLSLLIDDCITSGMDYNAGGARYNTSYIQGVGLGSVTDMLTALRYWVFGGMEAWGHGGMGAWSHGGMEAGKQGGGIAEIRIGFDQLLAAMKEDFVGYEDLRYKLVYETPKYGNDDDYADEQAVKVFEMFFDAVDGRPNARGGKHHIMMLPTTSHVYFGSVTGAMPDGRKAWQPLSEGISPVQGADIKGPTAVLKSASKIDHLRTGGTLLNQKFTPQLLKDDTGIRALAALIRGYFKLNGHHIQFNVVTAETLREAQKHPEKYRDLIVRVAGYSDYFNDLGEALQNEIIARTEQEGV